MTEYEKAPPRVEPEWEECMDLLERLPALDIEERRVAVERLIRNPSPGIRQRVLKMGAVLLTDEQLVTYLREDADDVLRNMGLEVMKLKGLKAMPLAVTLLKDADSDVVLQAVLVLGHLRDPRALEHLRGLLSHKDTNVAQAVILAMGRLGDGQCVADLLPFLKGDPWLQMAAIQALGDIRSPQAVKPLEALLPDLFLGPLAIEALARIGGRGALKALAKYWLSFQEQVDAETVLGLLSHVIEGYPAAARAVPGLMESLVVRLSDGAEAVRRAAASCLLAAGPTPSDEKALDVLAETAGGVDVLPSCLMRRKDMTGPLLQKWGLQREWGWELAHRYPSSVKPEVALELLRSRPDSRRLETLVMILEKVKDSSLAEPLLNCYLAHETFKRCLLAPALKAHKRAVTGLLSSNPFMETEDLLVIRALLGDSSQDLAREIEELPKEVGLRVIPQLYGRKALLRQLPWGRWLDEDLGSYAPLLADASLKASDRKLLPMLRRSLKGLVLANTIRALGEIEDKESIPLLLDAMTRATPLDRAFVIEALGRIGGPEARAALRKETASPEGKDARVAFMALSSCAIAEDVPLFKGVAAHPDWLVRLSAAEVLGRFPSPENRSLLTMLSSDPASVVSQRALALLEN